MVVPPVANMSRPRIAVIGCGNLLRRDDGVGCHVVRRLQRDSTLSARDDLCLRDAGTAGVAALYEARGCGAMILVDACRGLGTPGSVFEVPGRAIESPAPSGLNEHAFRWDHALYAARRIYGESFIDSLTVYLVEALDFSPSLELSEPVEAAASDVAARIRRRIQPPLVAA